MKTKIITFMLQIFLGLTYITSPHLSAQNFLWAKQMGSTTQEIGYDVAVDASGNVYTTGYFSGIADFNPGAGVYNLTSNGDFDIFVSKLDASGNFVWAKQMGSTSYDVGQSITTDSNGDVYVTGYFKGTVDFDPNVGVYNLTSLSGGEDIFICKLSAAGNLIWAKQMGGSNPDYANAIAVDDSGNVYTTGDFWGTADFDPGTGTCNFTSAGLYDMFVSKLDADGNFVWAKQMGGSSYEAGISLALDHNRNVYITGHFKETADFDPGTSTYNLTSIGDYDIFVTKLDASGNFLWAKQMGGIGYDEGNSIAVDGSGNVYLTGDFKETADFNSGTGVQVLISAGDADIFISKLDTYGNFLWVFQLGASGIDYGTSIAVDNSGNIHSTGAFSATADFNPGAGTYNLPSLGGSDIFVSEYDTDGNFIYARRMGGTSDEIAYSIAVDGSGNAYTTGYFAGTADFDPGAAAYNLTSVGSWDLFISKLGNVSGIESLTENSASKIYPNPSNGKFIITQTNNITSFEIFNFLGEVVYKATPDKNSNSSEINLSNAPEGIYFIKLYNGEKSHVIKIIIN
jgi:hypothetical protein